MRIQFVSQYFYPEPFSNTNIATALIEAGHELSVMTAVPNYGSSSFYEGFSNRKKRKGEWNEVSIERIWTYPRGNSSFSLFINYVAFALVGSWRALQVKRGTYDLVFVSLLSPIFMAIPAIIISLRLRIPLVYWLQDLWPESATENIELKNSIAVGALNSICGFIYRKADLLLVQSESFPSYLKKHNVKESRIRVFPNTAPDVFEPVEKETVARPGFLPEQGFNIMYAGNVGHSQGFDNVVEAARILGPRSTVNWVIVGRGRALADLKTRVASEGLSERFVFAGSFPEQKMPEFFAHADAMLVTLKPFPIFSLTVPYKVQTYLACGRPIIAVLDGEGARTISEAGAGITAEPGDPGSLASAAQQMARTSAPCRANMGENGRRYFMKKYSRDVVFANLRQWLDELEETRS